MVDSAKKLRTAYEIFLGVLTAVVGVLFIVEAAKIYFPGAESGGDIYSREIVAERLRALLIPVCVWLVAAIGGGIVAMLCPSSPSKASFDARRTLTRLSRRIPAGEGEAYLSAQKDYKKYGLIRTVSLAVVAVFGVLAAVMSCVYLFDTAHFTASEAGGGINGDILRMLKNVLPWIAVSFVLAVGAALLDLFIAPRALGKAKRLIALGKGNQPLPPRTWVAYKSRTDEFLNGKWTLLTVRICILCLGVIFLGLGIWNGGADDVLGKAIMICTECIGLG